MLKQNPNLGSISHLSRSTTQIPKCSRGLEVRAYLDGDLSDPIREQYQSHLRDCFDCQNELRLQERFEAKVMKLFPEQRLDKEEREYFVHEVFEALGPMAKSLAQNDRVIMRDHLLQKMGVVGRSFFSVAFSKPMFLFYVMTFLVYLTLHVSILSH